MGSFTWDMHATRSLMRAQLNENDYENARRSFSSAIDRRSYALLHYREIKEAWRELLLIAATPMGVWDVILGGTTESDIENQNEKSLHAIGAHTLACVQSLHAIPDIFAHGIYYSLGLAQRSPISPRKINVVRIALELSKMPEYKSLSTAFEKMTASRNFKFLSALANHGKHRSIVKNAVSADMTGTDPEPIRLKFEEFSYNGGKYESQEVLLLLQKEYDRISRNIIEAGIEVHRLLAKMA